MFLERYTEGGGRVDGAHMLGGSSRLPSLGTTPGGASAGGRFPLQTPVACACRGGHPALLQPSRWLRSPFTSSPVGWRGKPPTAVAWACRGGHPAP